MRHHEVCDSLPWTGGEYAEARHGFKYMDLDDFEELLLDKPADEKWELIGGRVVRGMVGARWEHHEIVQNVNFALRSHIRAQGLPCRTFTETFWLKQPFLKLAVFPDIMVRCGPMGPNSVSIDDPLIVIEVVSPGGEDRDRGRSGAVPAPHQLAARLLHRPRPRAFDVFDNKEGGWLPRPSIERIDDVLELDAIGFSMPVAEVYGDVLPRLEGSRTDVLPSSGQFMECAKLTG